MILCGRGFRCFNTAFHRRARVADIGAANSNQQPNIIPHDVSVQPSLLSESYDESKYRLIHWEHVSKPSLNPDNNGYNLFFELLDRVLWPKTVSMATDLEAVELERIYEHIVKAATALDQEKYETQSDLHQLIENALVVVSHPNADIKIVFKLVDDLINEKYGNDATIATKLINLCHYFMKNYSEPNEHYELFLKLLENDENRTLIHIINKFNVNQDMYSNLIPLFFKVEDPFRKRLYEFMLNNESFLEINNKQLKRIDLSDLAFEQFQHLMLAIHIEIESKTIKGNIFRDVIDAQSLIDMVLMNFDQTTNGRYFNEESLFTIFKLMCDYEIRTDSLNYSILCSFMSSFIFKKVIENKPSAVQLFSNYLLKSSWMEGASELHETIRGDCLVALFTSIKDCLTPELKTIEIQQVRNAFFHPIFKDKLQQILT
ncbi:MAG: hypothetical protein VW397_05880 [Candidatus Margulisiibacteriota bacterium]